MEIEPTAFVVRMRGYPQRGEFGEFCAESVNKLLASDKPPRTLDEFQHWASRRVKWFRQDDLPRLGVDGLLRFGEPLDRKAHGYLRTALNGRYEASFARALTRLWPAEATTGEDLFHQFTYRPDDAKPGTEPILLSQLFREKGKGSVTNQWDDANQRRLREAEEKAFAESLNPENSREKRLDSALECYYLFSHEMPFEAGSAMASQLLLGYLLGQADMRMPPMAEGYDLNLEALTTDWGDFRRNARRGAYFDRNATPQVITDWQRREIERQKNDPISLRHIVEMAFEMRDGGVVSSGERLLMKKHIEQPDMSKPSEDNPYPDRIEFRVDRDNKQQVRFHGLHNYIDESLFTDGQNRDEAALARVDRITRELAGKWHDRPFAAIGKHVEEIIERKNGTQPPSLSH